ncbi:MAG: AhpC/TSA family protein [Muribaculaceae bacterium]|nr:AhpC/TSA family protein [Muribaculaceae bacterium]
MYKTIIKSPLSWLIAMTVSFQACTAPTEFTITGHIDGMPDSIKVTLLDVEDPNGEFKVIADTMAVNGSFTLNGSVKSPVMCQLSFSRYNPGKDRYGRLISTRMMAENADIKVSSTIGFDSLVNVRSCEPFFKIEGSKANRELSEYLDFIHDAEMDERDKSYLSAAKYFETNDNPDSMAIYNAMANEAKNRLQARQDEFVAGHPAYNISGYLTQKELEKLFVYTADEIEAMVDHVSVCPDTARVATMERRKNHALKYALQRQCPEFKATDINGNVVDFTSLITPGRFTFIDFWASWCGPCRSAIPHVRELYEKYGDTLDVYSVSVDESAESWREAMDEEKMTWPQYHLDGEEQLGQAAKAFFITTIPRLILLDDSGKVICSTNLPAEVNTALEQALESEKD